MPKCRKGRSIKDALKEFCGSSTTPPARAVWAETKYDGYRRESVYNSKDIADGMLPVCRFMLRSSATVSHG